MEDCWQRIDRLVEEFDRLEPAVARRRLQELEQRAGDDQEEARLLELSVLRDLYGEDDEEKGLGQGACELLGESVDAAFQLDHLALGPGSEVGAFRLTERLGEGGMGTVFLAERNDGSFEQQVALKVLHRGPADEGSRRRFLRERQILASLRHPHIASLLDGGMVEGTPYLVLEYVDGQPITDYCAGRALPLQDRLRIFLQACEAIRLAHRQGVVHRDLKPSNVLVEDDAEGGARAVVLDFGIARVEDELERTATGQVFGTPGFIAPEQLQAARAGDARSDVYALGCLLHELVSEHRRFDGATTAGVLRRVWAAEPTPLREHLPRVDRDLETVVETAAALEPDRRYADVGALVRDVELLLDGAPVRARRVPRWERWWRRATRRPRTSAALAVALLVAGGSVTLWLLATVRHARELAEERNEAVAARAEAEDLLQFMVDDLHDGLDRVGRLDLLEQVARRSIDYQSRWGGEDLSDEQLIDQGLEVLRRRAAVRFNAGQILISQGDAPGAIAAYEANHQMFVRTVAAAVSDPRWAVELALSQQRLAMAFDHQGEVDRALSWARRAAEVMDSLELSQDASAEDRWRSRLVAYEVLRMRAWLEREAGSLDRSQQVATQALELAREATNETTGQDQQEWRHRQAVALSYGGLTAGRAGEPERARRAFTEALSVCADLVASDPSNTLWREELQLNYTRLGYLLIETGDAEGARSAFENARAHAQVLVDLEPQHVGWLRELAMSHYGLAGFHRGRGQYEVALDYAEQSLAVSRQLMSRGKPTPSMRNDLAADLLEVGQLRRLTGDEAGALGSFREGLERIDGVVEENPNSPYFLDTHTNLLLELGRVEEARAGAERLRAIDDSWPGLDDLLARAGLG